MDPALRELIRKGCPDEEIEAIIKLKDYANLPSDLRIVSRFGDIATCRLPRGRISEIWGAEAVESLKAPRLLLPEVVIGEEHLGDEASNADIRRPPELSFTGKGVIIGIIDFGCDFNSLNFRKPDGSTRIIALWDQSKTTHDSPEPYGYGKVYTRDDINRALQSTSPYEFLGYHPADSDPFGNGSHGTHVLDIAAGNGRIDGSPEGIATEADIIFVHLSSREAGGLANLGDSLRILESLDWISRLAGDIPWVVNLSIGKCGGPHDGLTLVEQGMDALLEAAPGRAIVQSAGNYGGNARIHSSGQLGPGAQHTLIWETDKADVTPNELEIWYSGRDRFEIELRPPDSDLIFRAALGEMISVNLNAQEVGRIYHRAHDPNGSNHVDIFLTPSAPFGSWQLTLIGNDVVDGRFHSWVERDSAHPEHQSRFHPKNAVSTSTTGTIANNFRCITVGAYNPHSPDFEIAEFSSCGPTRDGRQKPDLVAPGVSILAARSASRFNEIKPKLTRKSGTSLAAPMVTATIALMQEAAGRPLHINEIRKLLLSITRKPSKVENALALGNGYLDIVKAVKAAQKISDKDQSESTTEFKEELITDTSKKEATMKSEQFRLGSAEIVSENSDIIEIMENALSKGERIKSHSIINYFLPSHNLHETNDKSRYGTEYLSLSSIYDALITTANPVRPYLEQFFEIIARPGESLKSRLQKGDLLIRRFPGESYSAHLSVIALPELMNCNEARRRKITVESENHGEFAGIVEGGLLPHRLSDSFARLVLDATGRVPPYQLLLRPKIQESQNDFTRTALEVTSIELGNNALSTRVFTPEQIKYCCETEPEQVNWWDIASDISHLTENAPQELQALLRYHSISYATFAQVEARYFNALTEHLREHGILGSSEKVDRSNFQEAIREFQAKKGMQADGLVGEDTLWELQKDWATERNLKIIPVPADKVKKSEGFDYFRLREDVVDTYLNFYKAVKNKNGIVTSADAFRDLNVPVTAGRSPVSMHYSGLALDLATDTGMRGDFRNKTYYIEKEDRHWRVWCNSPTGQERILDAVQWRDKVVTTHQITTRVMDLTDIALSHGFSRIGSRSTFPSDYMSAEWWHFQFEKPLVPYFSQFGIELLSLEKYNEDTLSRQVDIWINRKRIFKRNVKGHGWF